MQNKTTWLTAAFPGIGLPELIERAEMMSRVDNKYIVTAETLRALVPSIQDAFDILDIDGTRAFEYSTRYFDDPGRSAYHEHHKGVRQGFKVRVRRYLDAGLCFLEVKVKGRRGMTEKFRQPHDAGDLSALGAEAASFARSVYEGQYRKSFDYDLGPALDINYQRITLVARTGGERMTIDTNLTFEAGGRKLDVGAGVFIIETKSADGRGLADRLLRAQGERPVKKCSKYCLGMATLGEVKRYNLFLPTMRKMGLVALAQKAASAQSEAGAISALQDEPA